MVENDEGKSQSAQGVNIVAAVHGFLLKANIANGRDFYAHAAARVKAWDGYRGFCDGWWPAGDEKWRRFPQGLSRL
ncbi:hypothetical protein GCM10011496_05500 [Polaromonas eurypsychrophila]|uniref:Uncharacterized protein n=1 Tax=Polaromonas eurypsychrophila TaxID=1614635 RepID=A0A916WC71_9BURK|nr:hypothetical protein GCM10011496_05500 [Polaromonas eurypsychrophila]